MCIMRRDIFRAHVGQECYIIYTHVPYLHFVEGQIIKQVKTMNSAPKPKH